MEAVRVIVPIVLREAHAFVKAHHRHHDPDRGAKFAIAVARTTMTDSQIVAVACVGRPKARHLDNGFTAEVTRLCSIDEGQIVGGDGRLHAPPTCAMLYAACWRAARAMGYRKLVTYILDTEPGITLSGAGWREVGEAGGGTWDRGDRPRVDTHPTQGKLRFEIGE